MVLKFCFKNTIEFRNKKVNIFSQNLPVETSLLWRLKGKKCRLKKGSKGRDVTPVASERKKVASEKRKQR